MLAGRSQRRGVTPFIRSVPSRHALRLRKPADPTYAVAREDFDSDATRIRSFRCFYFNPCVTRSRPQFNSFFILRKIN
jgi:hypothetical protein